MARLMNTAVGSGPASDKHDLSQIRLRVPVPETTTNARSAHCHNALIAYGVECLYDLKRGEDSRYLMRVLRIDLKDWEMGIQIGMLSHIGSS